MTASISDVRSAAYALLDAERVGVDRGPISELWSEFDLDTAYAVQEVALGLRLDRGEKLIGIKLGLTSPAKQQQMSVDQPIVAFLTDAMLLRAGEPVPQKRLIHPRVEPEIVFITDHEISGPGATVDSVATAIGSVGCGIEVIDSRFRNFSFTLPDVVADNASSAAFVLGPMQPYTGDLDLAAEACTLEIGGQVVASATGAATMGHPLAALAMAANMLAGRGWTIKSDWIVLTGGLTDAVAVEAGAEVVTRFSHLGSITLDGGDA